MESLQLELVPQQESGLDSEIVIDVEPVGSSDIVQEETVVELPIPAENDKSDTSKTVQWFQAYLEKFKGCGSNPLAEKPLPFGDIFISVLISFTGILLISVCHYKYLTITFKMPDSGVPIGLLIGSMGASAGLCICTLSSGVKIFFCAVLCFDMTTSPLSQPRNLVLGHCLSSIVGVCIRYFAVATDMSYFVAPALAVSIAIGVMRIFKCTHPPAGATALIAVVGGRSVDKLGFAYVLTSTGGAFIVLCVAILLNNLCPDRKFPLYWN